MTKHRTFTTALLFLAILLAAWMLANAAGCRPLTAIDDFLWKAPAGADPDTPPPGESGVELIAAIAAALGYGGLAAWLAKVRKNGKTTAAALATRIDAIETSRGYRPDAELTDLAHRMRELEADHTLFRDFIGKPEPTHQQKLDYLEDESRRDTPA